MAESAAAAKKAAEPEPLAPPPPPRPAKFMGYRVHIAAFGNFTRGQILSMKQLTQANVDKDRLEQLETEGVLSKAWE